MNNQRQLDKDQNQGNTMRERDRESHNVNVLFKTLQYKEWQQRVQTSYKLSYIQIELGQLPFDHITNMS